MLCVNRSEILELNHQIKTLTRIVETFTQSNRRDMQLIRSKCCSLVQTVKKMENKHGSMKTELRESNEEKLSLKNDLAIQLQKNQHLSHQLNLSHRKVVELSNLNDQLEAQHFETELDSVMLGSDSDMFADFMIDRMVDEFHEKD